MRLPRPRTFVWILALLFACLPGVAEAATSLPAGFEEITLASGIAAPVRATWAPDGRMFVADRSGVVYVHNPGAPANQNTVLLDISDHVNNGPSTDHGLLGITTDSSFASNGFLYLLYTRDDDTTDDNGPKVSTLTRVTVNPDNTVVGGQTDPTETTLLGSVHTLASTSSPNGVCGNLSNTIDCIPSEGSSHTIADVRSAPDGTLFVATGDGSDYNKVDPLAMNDDNPLTFRGKIMHVDRNGNGLAGHPFCPSDTNLTHVCTKIYAEGFRNPFRIALRPEGGLVIGDVGQGGWEEVDLSSGGENFGWPCFEGNGPDEFTANGESYQDFQHCQDLYANNTTKAPAMAIGHHYPDCDADVPTGDTIVGGPIYQGDQYPVGYRGQVIFGDVGGGFFDPSCGWLGRADISGNSLSGYQSFATGWPEGVDLESAPDGNLAYVSLSDGAVREIKYGPGNKRPSVSVSATPTSGQAPLSVNLHSSASDPDGDALRYDWDFGDGSPHSSDPNPVHVYSSAANWVATLTVDDRRGMSASASVAIPVSAAGGGGTKPALRLRRLRLATGVARLLRRGLIKGSFDSNAAVRSLNVSVWRGRAYARSCRWWSRRAHRLLRSGCKKPHWMRARLRHKRHHYTWTLKLNGAPPPGSYTLVLSARPRSSELGGSARTRLHLRVPRRR